MPRTFGRLWHAGLIYKLEPMGLSADLRKLIKDFLNNRFLRVLLNGNTSDWLPVELSVLQWSILRPLLFLIYINDLPDNLVSSVKFFADDTSLFSTVYDSKLQKMHLMVI